MELVRIYKCLCDRTRLRILNLLLEGPLCVCHVQEILDEPQAKVSKQLSYLKNHGAVESTRFRNWTLYALAGEKSPVFRENLRCLQDARREDPVFTGDLKRRSTVMARVEENEDDCLAVMMREQKHAQRAAKLVGREGADR